MSEINSTITSEIIIEQTYTAGDNVEIDDENIISVPTDDELVPNGDAPVSSKAVLAAIAEVEEDIEALEQSKADNPVEKNTIDNPVQNNTVYSLTNVNSLAVSFPVGNFDAVIYITTAASGSLDITFPATAEYIGKAPTFDNGEKWIISISNGVIGAVKVGDGT